MHSKTISPWVSSFLDPPFPRLPVFLLTTLNLWTYKLCKCWCTFSCYKDAQSNMFWSTNLTVIHATDGTPLSEGFLVLWMVCSICPWMDNWAPYFDILEMGPSWAAAGPAAVATQNLTFPISQYSQPPRPLHCDRSRGLNKRRSKNFTSSQALVTSIPAALHVFCFVFSLSVSACCTCEPWRLGNKCGYKLVGWTHICMLHLCTCKCALSEIGAQPPTCSTTRQSSVSLTEHFCIIAKMYLGMVPLLTLLSGDSRLIVTQLMPQFPCNKTECIIFYKQGIFQQLVSFIKKSSQ